MSLAYHGMARKQEKHCSKLDLPNNINFNLTYKGKVNKTKGHLSYILVKPHLEGKLDLVILESFVRCGKGEQKDV